MRERLSPSRHVQFSAPSALAAGLIFLTSLALVTPLPAQTAAPRASNPSSERQDRPKDFRKPSSRSAPDRTAQRTVPGRIAQNPHPETIATPSDMSAGELGLDHSDIDPTYSPPDFTEFHSHPECCADGACGDPQCCGSSRLWVRAEFLLWWVKGYNTPPLVTTSPVGTDLDDAGVLGQPDTIVLFGGNNLANDVRPGGRYTIGYWLDPCETTGIQASYFGVLQDSDSFSASSTTIPILARPFFNAEPGFEGEDAELVAFPGLFSGNISVRAQSSLQGTEVLLSHALCQGCNVRVDALLGWRNLQLNERLVVSDFKTALSADTGLAVGTTLQEFDRFATSNNFNGAQLGVAAECCHCRWSLKGHMKVNLGVNQASTSIAGQTISVVPVPGADPVITVTPAGLLAQGTNIGTHSRDQFTAIPELGVTLGYYVTDCLRATIGYSFLYWGDVLRPGDQIDRFVNLSQVTPGGLNGVPLPRYPAACGDVWAQGLNFGLEYRF